MKHSTNFTPLTSFNQALVAANLKQHACMEFAEKYKRSVNLFSIYGMAILILAISFVCFGQDKPHVNDDSRYFYSNSNDASNPVMTNVQQPYQENPERLALLNQLREARLSGNTLRAMEIQTLLNRMDGVQPSNYANNPSETGIEQTEGQYNSNGDGISSITGSNYWGIATQNSSRSSHIFVAVTEFNISGGDQLKVYVSYNRGVSWVLKGVYNGFASGVRFNTDELDIEPVIYGADTLLFAVGGYTYNGNKFSLIARFNIGTGYVYANAFSLSISTKNYNPRITSDNTVFGSNPYVYLSVSNDTVINATSSRIRQRVCVIQNPFNAGTFTQKHIIPTSGSFYWSHVAPTNTYFYQDIAYYYNSNDNTDNIYSATIFPGFNNVYAAWSKNMVSIAGSLIVNETMPITRVRLAFNGGGGNTNGTMIYLRNYTNNPAGDVDVRCQNTTSGGTLTSSFTASYVEFTSDTATTCDVQAVKLASNKFKFAYGVRGARCYYRSNTTTTLYTPVLLVNNLPGIRVKAGYRIAPTDSCLSIWSKSDGSGMYSTYGCDTYIGIQQNSSTVPAEFMLSQNYPNPFNPVTNIKFSVPQSSFVKLAVYDITGRMVATLVNQNMNAGSFTVDFDAASLSSGVYFYRIEANGFTDVKKMMLIK